MAKKVIRLSVRIVITLAAFGLGGFLLYYYEYITAFGDIDNVIGMLPVAFAFIFAGGITALLWMKHTKRLIPLSLALAVIVVFSAALFPTALRGNWWLNMQIAEGVEAKPDLTAYAPFAENTQAAKLDEVSTLTLSGDLPVLDGATALYPVYAAFAHAAYDKASYTGDEVLCTKTRGAYETITSGEKDIIFVAGASAQQKAAAKAAGVKLEFTPIGSEAFVFLAGKNNPINNITCQQIRNIYSGKTAKWRTLGWDEGGDIIAFQRPEGSGSQTGLQNIMGNLPIQSPQPLPDASLVGSNSLLKQISVEWNGVQPALGYSYRYYAATMYANPDSKLLSVEGISPTIENIKNKSYPFVNNFYAVTNGKPEGKTKQLIDWILSPQGQKLIEKTGYTPVN